MRIRPYAALGTLAAALSFGSPALLASEAAQNVRNLLQEGQVERALAAADRLASANPKDAEARFLRAVALAELNRSADAIAAFQKLTEDFPQLPEPYNNLAVLYAQQRDYDKARSALESAIRTHPSYATAHTNLADLYARLANDAYERALQLDDGRETRRTAAPRSTLALIRDLGPAASTPLVVASASAPVPPAPTRPPAVQAAPVAVQTAQAPAVAPPPTAASAPAKPVEPAPGAAAPAKPEPPTPASPAPTQTAAAAQPAATPAQPAAPAAGDNAVETAVLSAVQAWADAWARQDVKAYLSHYDASFQVPGSRSRQAWEREREQRLNKPGKITVEVDNPQVSVNGDQASVRFLQRYRSVDFNASTMKTLDLVRRGNQWQITQERVGR